MAARFEKFSGGSFDGFDAKSLYQMVPVQGKREIGLVTESEECLLYVQDPEVASLANFTVNGQLIPIRGDVTDQMPVGKNLRVEFSILGIAAKPTLVVLDGPRGNLLTLAVSVKAKVVKTYSLLFLSDSIRATVRPKAEAAGIMKKVAATYLKQANLQLDQLGDSADVAVAGDLGNPLNVKRSRGDVVKATPAGVCGVNNILIYSTWNVTSGDSPDGKDDAVGVTAARCCFVEDGDNQFSSSLTYGHEVGHALGLDHNGDTSTMMNSLGVDSTSKLLRHEIDTVNATGLEP